MSLNPEGKAAGHEFFDGATPNSGLMSLAEFTSESESNAAHCLEPSPVNSPAISNVEDFMHIATSLPGSPEPSRSAPESPTPAMDQGGERSKLSQMFDAGTSSVASKLPWFSNTDWKHFAGREHGQDSYKFGDVTRGMVQQAIPSIRERIHKTRAMALDAKETWTEKKQQMLSQVVSHMQEETAASAASVQNAANPAREAKRLWAEARAAVHVDHNLDADPSSLPERACPQEGEASRGCLEVEVLAYGGAAVGPVCQLAFGGICTGALWPRDRSTASSSRSLVSAVPSGSNVSDGLETCQRFSGGSEPSDIGDAVCSATSGAAAASSTTAAVSSGSAEGDTSGPSCEGQKQVHKARFAVDEILGSDLRVHVFDSKQSSFNLGMEEQAFCGGALLPVTALLRRNAKPTLYSQGFFCQVITDEVKVALLPLEAVRMEKKKLKSVEADPSGLERPLDLGHILLRLQLTLYDMVPAQLYFARPFRGERLEEMTDLGRIDEPMSVLKAVAAGIQRVKRALAPELLVNALDQLREAALSSCLLLFLWTYAILIAPVWKLPGVFAAVSAMVVWEISSQAHLARVADPPRLYKDELPITESGLSHLERVKKGAEQAIKVELGLMQFARGLHTFAQRAEKILYLVTLQDPYLSIICGGLLTGVMFTTSMSLWVVIAIFGRRGPPLLVWACGLLLILPSNCRAHVVAFTKWLQEVKTRLVGPGKLKQMLESFWLRIPDGPEAIHYELFERYLMVP